MKFGESCDSVCVTVGKKDDRCEGSDPSFGIYSFDPVSNIKFFHGYLFFIAIFK